MTSWRHTIPRTVVATAVLFLSVAALADDWPQWRGPNRDGVWRESGILEAFPKDGLKIRWRAGVGPGYSGVVVANGRVYVTDCQLKPESVERVLCFDEATGRPLWTCSYPCNYKSLYFGAGPYATPIVHEGKVFVCGPLGHLHCLDAATGRVIWEKDRVKEYDAVLPQSGCNASPLIEGDLLVVMGGGRPDGGCVMAFQKDSGKEVWSALPERPGASSPMVLEAGGKRQLVVWTLDSVSSLNPTTGAVYWRVPARALNDGGALITPLAYKDRLLLTCEKTVMLRLHPDQPAVTPLYQTKAHASHFTFVTPVFQDEHYFYAGFRDDLCCFDADTGKEVWQAQGVSAGHGNAMFQMTPNGQSVFIFNEEGNLILSRLAPEGYREISRTFLIEPTKGTWAPIGDRPKTWAHPAYANRHIFARSDKELVCASLAVDGAD